MVKFNWLRDIWMKEKFYSTRMEFFISEEILSNQINKRLNPCLEMSLHSLALDCVGAFK